MRTDKINHNWIIEINNKKPIGSLFLSYKNKKTTEVHIVIGENKYRGKGIGTIAMQKTLDKCFNKLGYSMAYLEVRPDNLKAIKMYKSLGFNKIKIIINKKNKYQPKTVAMELKKKNMRPEYIEK